MFINPLGFDPNSSNPTNVNYYYYLTTPGPLSQADIIQNIANLKYLPRVPVFIQTNPGTPLDFRFYLDLNRNGQFDDTGNNLPDILEDGTTNVIPGAQGLTSRRLVIRNGSASWPGRTSRIPPTICSFPAMPSSPSQLGMDWTLMPFTTSLNFLRTSR